MIVFSGVTVMSKVDDLRLVLPGTWRIHASTFPMWLRGKRTHPTITYTPLPGDELRLRDEVGYRTRSGAPRRIVGVDRYRPDDRHFVWRGSGPLWILASRWRVELVSADREFLVVTFDRSLVTPAGMDVLGRGEGARPDLPDRVAAEASALGPGRLARLTWL